MTALAASLLASATLGLVSAQTGGPSRVDAVRRAFPVVASRLAPREAPAPTRWHDLGRPVDGWRGAHVRLPRLASDPQVADGEGVTVVRRPRDARAVLAEEAAGHLIYADAWPHTDVLQARGPEWTEELLHLRSHRAPREFAYELQLRGVETAGIEDGAVRFLDAAGRGLVLTRPVVIDAAGRRSATAARWILALPSEGGTRRLTLRLDPAGLDYPLLVDPAWIPTGSLNQGRNNPLGILLQTGEVLVMAGAPTIQVTAELYNPATGAWRFTAPVPSIGFTDHAAVLLRDGRVLVSGGAAASELRDCWLYDPVAGVWSAAGLMSTPRRRHSLTLLPDGRVLAVGGLTTGFVRTATAEIYDPTANAWTPVAAPSVARWGHFAALLRDGRVLVAAGEAIVPDLRKTEIFDPATGLWAPAGDLADPRGELASGTLLPDGRVLAAGGNGPSSSELFDPTTGLWTPTGSLAGPRYYHSATLLPSGKVVVAGGFAGANLGTSEVYDPGTGQWSAGPPLGVARRRHSATMMPDGRVLVAGGDGSLPTAELLEIDAPSWGAGGVLDRGRREATASLLKNGRVLLVGGVSDATAEVHDPATGTSSPTVNALSTQRWRHTATVLADGRVLVAGTVFSPASEATAEVYDPGTNQWTPTGSMAEGRHWHVAALLPCGEVLVAGGRTSGGTLRASAERYHPRSGTWRPTASMGTARWNAAGTLLADGRVLVTGGWNGADLATAEIYDPVSETWTPTAGTMGVARSRHDVLLLPSGRVLVGGGLGANNVELFDPATGTFSNLGLSTAIHGDRYTLSLLPNGRALLAGGFGSPTSAEVFDPVTASWTPLPALAPGRDAHTATVLLDGRVLLAGGDGTTDTSTTRLDAGRGESPAWRPAVAGVNDPIVTGAALAVGGSGFQGLGEGSTGVGWMQSATNYPLVQVRRLDNDLVRWLPVDPAVGWSGTSYRSRPLGGIPPGPALVTVFTSGIPSVSRMVAIECPPPTVTASPTSQSVCQGDAASFSVAASGDCPAFQWSKDAAPILEGGRFTGTRATTLSITNVQPADAGAYKATVALACSSTVVESASATLSVTALLSSVTAALAGPATVCSTCLGGTASESHVAGGSVARQWGYRTTSGGTITDIPGATAASYVLNGADFPGAGGYFLVVRVTPACGTLQVSNELAVTVDDSPPPGDVVRFFTVTSRSVENVLEWINPPAGGTVSIRFNGSSTSCAFPATETDGAPVPGGAFVATGSARERLVHSSLVNTSVYCYSIFYDSGGGWKGPRTNSGRPFDTSGNVKWAFSSGLFSTTPPTVGGAGVIATNNDNVVHAMERGALGGEWPAGWKPALLGGAVQGRSPIVPILVGSSNPVAFLGAQDGAVYAVDAAVGGAVATPPWTAPAPLGGVVQAAPAGIFTAFSGAFDYLLAGTRDALADNALVALDPADGSEKGRYQPAAAPDRMGIVSGAAAVDYATSRVYFASHARSAGDTKTLWCLQLGTSPVFTLGWARDDLGDIESSPVIRGGRVYVGSAQGGGTVYSIDAAAGDTDSLARKFVHGDGQVKGFVFPDRASPTGDAFFATDDLVWVVQDDGATLTPKYAGGVSLGGGVTPSAVLYVPGSGRLYAGGSDGRLHEIDVSGPAPVVKSVVLGDGAATVGAPSYDLAHGLVHVGTASGAFYAVQVPLP